MLVAGDRARAGLESEQSDQRVDVGLALDASLTNRTRPPIDQSLLQILKEERQKAEIQRKLHELTEQLHRTNESLAKKTGARNEYDTTIQETEAAYMKILESSQTLLHVLKRESVNLVKKKQTSSTSSN